MLEAQQDGEQNATGEESGICSGKRNRENEDAIHHRVVLEMDMVDDEEARRQEDG